MTGYIRWVDELNPIDFLKNVVLDLFVLNLFGVFFSHDLKVLDVVDNKEERSDFEDVFFAIIETPHHVIKLYFSKQTVNHYLPVMNVDVLQFSGVYPPPANKNLNIRIKH